MNRIALYLSNAIDVRSNEIRALVWAFLYFFFPARSLLHPSSAAR